MAKISKGHNSVKNVDGVMSNCGLYFYKAS